MNKIPGYYKNAGPACVCDGCFQEECVAQGGSYNPTNQPDDKLECWLCPISKNDGYVKHRWTRQKTIKKEAE